MAVVKGRYFFNQIFLLLLSRLLLERFTHKHGVESLGVDESQLLCLGSRLGKILTLDLLKKEGLESSKQMLFV